MDKLTVVAWNAINGAPMVFEEHALSALAQKDARIKELLDAMRTLVSRYELDGIPNDSLQAIEVARAALAKED